MEDADLFRDNGKWARGNGKLSQKLVVTTRLIGRERDNARAERGGKMALEGRKKLSCAVHPR